METLKWFGISKEMADKLSDEAYKASLNAYASYSHVYVGAALLTENDEIIHGANMENASYGATICAERCAIWSAKAKGVKSIKALGVFMDCKGLNAFVMPCGMCRQVLVEFGYFPIILARSPFNYIVMTNSSLLPSCFKYLNVNKTLSFPSSNSINQILDAAQFWIQCDPYIETRNEVLRWIVNDQFEEMKKAFCNRIDFGTAGLRSEMGPGYSRMNYIIVMQTAQGIAKYLLKEFSPEECKTKGIFIGYDGRHNSRGYAHISAAVFEKNGIKPYLTDDHVITPSVPFMISKLGTLAGIMVTASHNPKQDNGYKVYWTNAAQITSPTDKFIKESIEKNLDMHDIAGLFDNFTMSYLGKNFYPKEKVINLYAEEVMKKCHTNSSEINLKCKPITYTAMHGVGYPFFKKLFEGCGFSQLITVDEQIQPDPEFRTVKYPNPEEGEGSLLLSFKKADSENSTVIIANDPDADRTALSEKINGNWKIFTGDQIGSMLAHYLILKAKNLEGKKAVVSSTVSSKLIKAIAEKNGIRFEETLTGFKWIGNKAYDLQKEGYQIIFSYEEAIGFCVHNIVKDKDGVSAGIILSEMYAQFCAENKTFHDYLQGIYKEFGYYITKNHYFKVYDPSIMFKVFENIRNEGKYAEKCGAYKIKSIRDLTVGYDDSQPDKKPILPVSSSTQMITFFFENNATCTLRGSGTEPKLKYYIEYHDKTEEDTFKILQGIHHAIVEEYLKPEKTGLIDPSKDKSSP